MNPQTRSLFCKVVICASICLGAFIAFKFFRTGIQEIVDAGEIIESSSPAMPTEDETITKEIGNMTEEELQRMTTTGKGYSDYAWMVNPSVSAKGYRETLQEKGAFDAWYAGMDEPTRQYFDQRIKEEEKEIAKINAEAKDYRASLTKEQRAAFDRGVAELTKKMQGVPEQGLATYISKLPQAWSWGEPEVRQLAWWWASKSAEERKNYTFPAAIEQAIRENHEYLESIKREEQEPKKAEQKKTVTPKAPEKKPAATKQQEAKGKKAQPMTPSKTTGPATKEKSTIVAPAKAEPVKPTTPKEAVKPMVTVRNNIQKKMTGYRKFGKNWYPDDYSLTINGVQVDEGDEIAVPSGDGSVCNVVFAYDFRPMGKSYKKGIEEVNHVLTADIKELDVTFSWYKTPNIIVTPVMGSGVSNQGGSKVQGA